MSLRSLMRSLVLITAAASPLTLLPNAAHAQGLIDFLWGGTEEWGGKRQIVDFDSKYSKDQIIVSFGDRRLYLITEKGKAISYPIAVPREQSRWQGTTAVSEKKINPAWRPTPDMLKENPKLPTWVPGGHPMNPLGVRAIYLGASTYRIHGTDAPWTIGQAVSKGCVRMYNEDVLDLYPRVPVGMKVTVTWQQFNSHEIASNEDGSPAPFNPEPASFGTSAKTRTMRSMTPPPAPGLTPDNVGTANKMPPPAPSTDDKPAKSKLSKAAPKPKKPDAVATTTPVAAPASAASAPAVNQPSKAEAATAVEAATKAAEAAARAAESARAAAEAAKKAAADAKKAASADGEKEPAKDDASKRAAL